MPGCGDSISGFLRTKAGLLRGGGGWPLAIFTIASVSQGAAPETLNIPVKIPGGEVTLSDPQIHLDGSKYKITTTVINSLNLYRASFLVSAIATMRCADGSLPVKFAVQLGPIWAKSSTAATAPIGLDHEVPSCSFSVASAMFVPDPPSAGPKVYGNYVPPEDAREIANRLSRMKTLPFVSSDASSLFVASDRKCAAQFQLAAPGEGLEAKKKLAEIISLCGTVVNSGSRIDSYRIEGEYGFVSIFESEIKGWVPRTWIWVPDQK